MQLLMDGISHIEDLAVDEFLRAVRFGNEMIVTEKLDGANLSFGFDGTGNFYTSREGKGGKQFYSVDDFGNNFWEVGFKAAHLALEKVAPRIRKANVMTLGDLVECEILFGALPNTVPYSGDINQIVFLRAVAGSLNIEELHALLDGKTVSVALKNVPYTVDGKTISKTNASYTWRFVKVPSVDPKLVSRAFSSKVLEYKLDELERFLTAPSGIMDFSNVEVISLPLNKRPDRVHKDKWALVLPDLKRKKAELIKQFDSFKLDIKDQLLDSLVRNVSSAFGPDVKDGGWIEGLVFRDPKTNTLFKLVDKNVFTMFNKFNWGMRNLLKSTGASRLRSLLGKTYLTMAEEIGHPQVATSSARRYVQELGNSPEERLAALSKGIKLEDVRNSWLLQLDKTQKVAQRILDWYEKNKQKLTKNVTVGSKQYSLKYDGAIDEKTKQSFATLFAEIAAVKQAVQTAKTPAQLVSLLVKPEYLNADS